MSKKDYEALAHAVRQANDNKASVARCIAAVIQENYPNFDKQLFLSKCGVSE